MTTALISVIVPVYNIASYLPRCLDSLLAQTYSQLEIIAVNDGSTDESGAILDEYAAKDKRIKVIHKENGGVSAARNDGLDAATGEFIGFCDGDDYVDKDMYEILINNALKHNVDISHCGVTEIKLNREKLYKYQSGLKKLQDRETGMIDLLSGEIIEPSNWNKLYRASLFNDVRFDSNIKYNEDNLINFKLFQKANSSFFEDVCKYNYVRREGSACKQKTNSIHVFHPAKVREEIYRLCVENKESEKVLNIAKASLLNIYISAYCLITSKAEKEFGDYKKYFRDKIKKQKSNLHLLSRNKRIMAYLILYGFGLRRPFIKLYYNR